MGAQQHAVTAGRLAQPVDFLTQRQQLLTGLLEGVHQLGVPSGQGVDASFELLHFARAAGPTPALHLLAQQARLPTQLLQLGSLSFRTV